MESLDVKSKLWANNFWYEKKVLVTGHTGFKGSWLCYWLHALGAKVIGYGLAPNSEPSLFRMLSLDDLIISYIADINEYSRLQNVIEYTKPDIIFHLAAQPLVSMACKNPARTFETNIMGTVNLFEALKSSNSVRVCQIITSDKCYHNDDKSSSFKEEDSLGGSDPYSASKACVEIVTAAYRNAYAPLNVSIATARAGNVIGGGDWSCNRLLPDCMRALQTEQTIMLRNVEATRPWQYVLDPLAGYLILAEKQWHKPKQYSEAFNLGPKESLTVSGLVTKVIETWGHGNWEQQAKKLYTESHSLCLNSKKAQDKLGWYCAYEVETAIKQSVWEYQILACCQSAEDVRNHCHDSIKNYIKIVCERSIPWMRK